MLVVVGENNFALFQVPDGKVKDGQTLEFIPTRLAVGAKVTHLNLQITLTNKKREKCFFYITLVY